MNPSYLRWLRWGAAAFLGLVLAGGFALACTFVYLAPALPTAETMHKVELAVPLRVYSRTGGLISQIGEQRRIPVTFDDIPPLVRQAVLAAEDDRFFEHSGLDWMGVTRSIVMNVISADAGQGGSTITQQAARNMFLTLDKTLRRKLSEVFVTYRMERDFTKEQILATYLNVILFGQRSYGIAAAAETYYGKHLDELTVAQAATLAGIIQRPSDQNPVTNPKNAERRRAYVLRRMRELGYIDQATAEAAAKEPVASRGYAPLVEVEAPYMAELARQEIVRRFGEAAVNAGYKVYTTLDGRLQGAANRAVRVGLIEYDRRHGYRGHLGKVELPAAASATDLDALLKDYDAISLLQPAVVTSVAATSAEVHIRELGKARINWDGLSWAAKGLKNGAVGAAPTKASQVVAPGDVIYVVTDSRGTAQLAQVPEAQGALVALDPNDGAVVSMVGGFNYYTNKFNRVTQARRQPGSGFKPFLYSAALDNGYTPASIVMDVPPVINEEGSEERWRPENSGGVFGGPMRLREGLVRSRNYISIRLLQTIGVDTAIERAGLFGLNTETMPHNLTLALGSLSVSPLQMATGYAVFANGGFKIDPYYIARIEDSSGKVVFEATPLIACIECEHGPMLPPAPPQIDPLTGQPVVELPLQVAAAPVDTEADGEVEAASALPATHQHAFPQRFRDIAAPGGLRELALLQGGPGFLPAERLAPRVLSPQNTWLMADIMHDVARRGTGVRTNQLGRDDLAGKTGTTNDNRDAWFNGFNTKLVATVWIGFDNEQSLGRGEEGSSAAVPMWIHYMREALRNVPSSRLDRPAGLIDLKISPISGELTNPRDPNAMTETFMVDHLPRDATPEALRFNLDGMAAPDSASGAEAGTEAAPVVPRRREPLF